jgi:hypothetical protein
MKDEVLMISLFCFIDFFEVREVIEQYFFIDKVFELLKGKVMRLKLKVFYLDWLRKRLISWAVKG